MDAGCQWSRCGKSALLSGRSAPARKNREWTPINANESKRGRGHSLEELLGGDKAEGLT